MKDKEDLPFAKRYGFEPIEIPFQLEDIDSVLRIELWNSYYIYIVKKIELAPPYLKSNIRNLNKILWVHYFKKPLDDFSNNDFEFSSFVRNYIEETLWYKVYEFFEFIFRNIENDTEFEYVNFENYIVEKLKENNSGYTIISNKFVPIINQVEIDELKQTQESAKKYKLIGVQEHLNCSLELISKKPNPNLRNSIKESISMVEVISRIIEPKENTLGKALNRLDRNNKISATLKTGFEKLYAYTNDKNGIRHALMDDYSIDIEDAKFFLVSCSAFTNYLIEKAHKENLLIEEK